MPEALGVEQIVLHDSARGPDAPSSNVLEGGLRWTVTDVDAKKEIILAGMGWAGLPEHVAVEALAKRKLVVLRVPDFEEEPWSCSCCAGATARTGCSRRSWGSS